MLSPPVVRLFASCVIVWMAASACGNSPDEVTPTPTTDATPSGSPSPPAAVASPEATIDAAKLPVELPMPAPLPSDLPVEGIDVVDLSSGRFVEPNGLSRRSYFGGSLLSPDGQKLARLSGLGEIEVVNVSSGNANRFTLPGDPPSLGTKMSWAPDSLGIATTTYMNVFVLNTSAGTMSQATSTTQPQVGIGDLAWSPDGKWIAYADGFFLTRIHPDGSERATGPKYYGGPNRIAWSPTSASFAFDALDLDTLGTRGPLRRIFLSDPDLNARPVTSGGMQVSWSPSGDGFTFLSPANPGESLLVANADGSNQHMLANLSPTTVSLQERIEWSPDGRWVAVSAEGVIHLVSSVTGEDVTAVRPPPPVRLEHGTYERCSVSVLGWVSATEIMTLMTCRNEL